MRLLILLGVLVVAAPPALEAQKNCKKGIPCGNTCIAANKVCRIAPPAAPAPRPLTSTAPAGSLYHKDYPFAASPRGRTYYRNVRECNGVGRLASRIYFKTEEDAIAAGLSRSRQEGC